MTYGTIPEQVAQRYVKNYGGSERALEKVNAKIAGAMTDGQEQYWREVQAAVVSMDWVDPPEEPDYSDLDFD